LKISHDVFANHDASALIQIIAPCQKQACLSLGKLPSDFQHRSSGAIVLYRHATGPDHACLLAFVFRCQVASWQGCVTAIQRHA
jgi:hypothetical protein